MNKNPYGVLRYFESTVKHRKDFFGGYILYSVYNYVTLLIWSASIFVACINIFLATLNVWINAQQRMWQD